MRWPTPQQQAQQAPVDPNAAFDAYELPETERAAYRHRRWSTIIPPYAPPPIPHPGTNRALDLGQGIPSDAVPNVTGARPSGLQVSPPLADGGYEISWTPLPGQTSVDGIPWTFQVEWIDRGTRRGTAAPSGANQRATRRVKSFPLRAFAERINRATLTDEDSIESYSRTLVVEPVTNWLDPENLAAYRQVMRGTPMLAGALTFDLAQQSRTRLEQVLAYETGDIRTIDTRGADRPTGLPDLIRALILYVEYDIDNFRNRIGSKTIHVLAEPDPNIRVTPIISRGAPQATTRKVTALAAFNGELITDIGSNLWAARLEEGE